LPPLSRDTVFLRREYPDSLFENFVSEGTSQAGFFSRCHTCAARSGRGWRCLCRNSSADRPPVFFNPTLGHPVTYPRPAPEVRLHRIFKVLSFRRLPEGWLIVSARTCRDTQKTRPFLFPLVLCLTFRSFFFLLLAFVFPSVVSLCLNRPPSALILSRTPPTQTPPPLALQGVFRFARPAGLSFELLSQRFGPMIVWGTLRGAPLRGYR